MPLICRLGQQLVEVLRRPFHLKHLGTHCREFADARVDRARLGLGLPALFAAAHPAIRLFAGGEVISTMPRRPSA